MLKTSEIYKMAQYAVLQSEYIGNNEKLEILRELMAREDVSLFVEKQSDEEMVALGV
jgi:hypothetical protein